MGEVHDSRHSLNHGETQRQQSIQTTQDQSTNDYFFDQALLPLQLSVLIGLLDFLAPFASYAPQKPQIIHFMAKQNIF